MNWGQWYVMEKSQECLCIHEKELLKKKQRAVLSQLKTLQVLCTLHRLCRVKWPLGLLENPLPRNSNELYHQFIMGIGVRLPKKLSLYQIMSFSLSCNKLSCTPVTFALGFVAMREKSDLPNFIDIIVPVVTSSIQWDMIHLCDSIHLLQYWSFSLYFH